MLTLLISIRTPVADKITAERIINYVKTALVPIVDKDITANLNERVEPPHT